MHRPKIDPSDLQKFNIHTGARHHKKQQINPFVLASWEGQWLNLYNPSKISRSTIGAHVLALAQQQGLQCVWLTSSAHLPYAPDLQEAGVVLESLPCITVPGTDDALAVASQLAMHHAADMIVMEGAWHQMIARSIWSKLQHWSRRYRSFGLVLSAAKCVEGARHLNAKRDADGSLMCTIAGSHPGGGMTQEVCYVDAHRMRFSAEL